MPLVAPSILASDFAHFADELADAERLGADMHHVDVMDGHFVPNLTFGPGVVKALKQVAKIPLDVHLMIEYPEKWVDKYIEAGADIVTVHIESKGDPVAAFRKVQDAGVKAGITLNPDTPFKKIEPLAAQADLILIMSVFPGFGGQIFLPETLEKVEQAAALKKKGAWVEIDGGINALTAPKARKAGCDILVAGAFFFGSKDRKEAMRVLKA